MSDIPQQDNANYQKMAELFANADEANAAVASFAADVYAARNKHRIKDVYVIVQLATTMGDVMTTFAFGRETEMEALAAYGFGHEQSQRQQRIMRMLEMSPVVTKPKNKP